MLPKCLEWPHNTYDRSTNSSRLQHRRKKLLSKSFTNQVHLSRGVTNWVLTTHVMDLSYIDSDAGRTTNFAPGKSLWFFELFLELSLFNFRFLFCGLWSGFMKGIMKGYERCSKMLRIWRKNSLKRVLSFLREYWVYFDTTWKRSSEFEFWGEFGKSRDFFRE